MKKPKEVGVCVLLLSPPGFEVFLIILTHLLSITCQFSSRPALFTGQGRYLPTVVRASPYWNHWHRPVWWSAQQNARSPILCAAWNEATWWERLIFCNPQASVFSLDLTPLPRGIFLNFLMDCLTSQCVCEAVSRNVGRTAGKELHDFAREHFVVTFQVATQHAGPWFGYLSCSLNKLELRKLPRSLQKPLC